MLFHDHWLDCCESNTASLYSLRHIKVEDKKEKSLSPDACTSAHSSPPLEASEGRAQRVFRSKSKRYAVATRGTKRERQVEHNQSQQDNRQRHRVRHRIRTSAHIESGCFGQTTAKSYYVLPFGKPRSDLGSEYIRSCSREISNDSDSHCRSSAFNVDMNKEFRALINLEAMNFKTSFGDYGDNTHTSQNENIENTNASGCRVMSSEGGLCQRHSVDCYKSACLKGSHADQKQQEHRCSLSSPQKALEDKHGNAASGVEDNRSCTAKSANPNLRFNLTKILEAEKNAHAQASLYNQSSQLSPMISQESEQSDGSLEYIGNWMQKQQQQQTNSMNSSPPVLESRGGMYSVAPSREGVAVGQHQHQHPHQHQHRHHHQHYGSGAAGRVLPTSLRGNHSPCDGPAPPPGVFSHPSHVGFHQHHGDVGCCVFLPESDPFTDIMSDLDFLTVGDPYCNSNGLSEPFPEIEDELNEGERGEKESANPNANANLNFGCRGTNGPMDKCRSCDVDKSVGVGVGVGGADCNRKQQLKALEWLFIGKSCTCQKHNKEKVRGKPVKDLPCCKCLMEVFMTVHDAKKASKHCGMSPTTFKKRLRKIGIKTYPSRKIRCLFRCIQAKCNALASIKDAEERVRIHDDLAKCREELRNFKDKLECVLNNGKAPARLVLDFSGRFTKIRNRIHKTNYKKKRSSLSE